MIKLFKKLIKTNKKTIGTLNYGVRVSDCKNCSKTDLERYFDRGSIEYAMFMKYQDGKFLVSKEMFKHIMNTQNVINVTQKYDFEFVDSIEL